MKTCDEWNSEFDLLYDNIASGKAPGLTTYEKSVFLTDAQEAVVLAVYDGTAAVPFEATELSSRLLSSLVSRAVCPAVETDTVHVVPSSVFHQLPDDLLVCTLESCVITTPSCGDMQVIVVPVTQDELWRTMRDPFKGSNSRRVLRVSSCEPGNKNLAELISNYPIVNYTVTYLRRPKPIILENLSDGLTIRGASTASTCGLDESIHHMILEEAVRRAKVAWQS